MWICIHKKKSKLLVQIYMPWAILHVVVTVKFIAACKVGWSWLGLGMCTTSGTRGGFLHVRKR